MAEKLMMALIALPAASGLVAILFLRNTRSSKEAFALIAAATNLLVAALIFNKDMIFSAPWIGFGFEISLRLYRFSAFIILATALFGFLITLYSVVFMRGKPNSGTFYALLLFSLALINGAALANNLILMLFFWEAMLITLWGMISLGGKYAFRTASKAFIILGACDLCMMGGIALLGHIAGTFTISDINIAASGMGGLAFILMVIGALAKSGSMPFHTWIPDAATDAPLPFMALFPGALEKLLGIYLLARISLDMFKLTHDSWASFALMAIGAITIIGAVMMALIQKDYKRLLSYHAVSQVGYMVLGIGTLVPIGIIGGLFHMINNAIYKSCLFLTGGSVERQAGTTDLDQLGGLGKMMPVTFACFLISALSISGVPPFNGFFSKELIYEGALERGRIFYVAAVLGSFLTAASFLKLGHAAFLGKSLRNDIREAPIPMLIPAIFLSGLCILFGLWNALPINGLIQPIFGPNPDGHNFAGWPADPLLITITIAVLLAALINHIYGVKRTGSALRAVDHIHYAPGLHTIYENAENGRLDPFNMGMSLTRIFAACAGACDRAVSWIYDSFVPSATGTASAIIRNLHDGSYKTYIIWSIAAAAIVIYFLLK